jgi:membrane-associated protease RseP (regulator of RpoE activity)
MLSHVMTQAQFLSTLPHDYPAGLIQEGQSIIYLGMKYLVFGEVLPSATRDVFVHPIAFAGWAGFLVTALNLMPIGQLDGGHVLYGLFGDNAQKARWPIIGVLVVLATAGTLNDMGIMNLPIGWSGWWIWVALLVFLVRNHAPVLDEITGLDAKRKALGVAILIIFVLIFTPRPLVPVEIQNAGQTALHAIVGLLG